MNWLKRFFGVKTNFEIMMEHVDKSHARDIDLIRAQMATIDRVVAARFDRPTFAQESRMPQPEVNADDLVDVNVDDDTWIARQQTQ